MSLASRLRVLVVCVGLEMGVLSGVPMRPDEIQDLMHQMNQPNVARASFRAKTTRVTILKASRDDANHIRRPHRSSAIFCYRSANAISIVTRTGTGSPPRVPGRNRHCPTALIAS